MRTQTWLKSIRLAESKNDCQPSVGIDSTDRIWLTTNVDKLGSGPCELFGFGKGEFKTMPVEKFQNFKLGLPFYCDSDVMPFAWVKVCQAVMQDGIPGVELQNHVLLPVTRNDESLFHRYTVHHKEIDGWCYQLDAIALPQDRGYGSPSNGARGRGVGGGARHGVTAQLQRVEAKVLAFEAGGDGKGHVLGVTVDGMSPPFAANLFSSGTCTQCNCNLRGRANKVALQVIIRQMAKMEPVLWGQCVVHWANPAHWVRPRPEGLGEAP